MSVHISSRRLLSIHPVGETPRLCTILQKFKFVGAKQLDVPALVCRGGGGGVAAAREVPDHQGGHGDHQPGGEHQGETYNCTSVVSTV